MAGVGGRLAYRFAALEVVQTALRRGGEAHRESLFHLCRAGRRQGRKQGITDGQRRPATREAAQLTMICMLKCMAT